MMIRAFCQSGHRRQSATHNARSALVSLGRLVCASEWPAAVARRGSAGRAHAAASGSIGGREQGVQQGKHRVGRSSERGNVSDCPVDGVLRRHRVSC